MATTSARGRIDIEARVKGEEQLVKAADKIAKMEKELARLGTAMREVEKNTTSMNATFKQTENVGKGMFKSFVDIKSAASAALTIFGGMAKQFDEMATRGFKLTNMQNALTFSIEEARKATGGLVDEYTLIEAANRGVALGVDLNSKSFANMARAAVIMAQKMGVDAKTAIDSLITGLGRQSALLLDNIGLIVKVKEANEKYALSLNKQVSELTDAEKKTAFMAEAMDQLSKKAREGEVAVDGAGGAWARFKVSMTEAGDQFAKTASKSGVLTGALDNIAMSVKWLAKNFTDLYTVLALPGFEKQIITKLADPLQIVRKTRDDLIKQDNAWRKTWDLPLNITELGATITGDPKKAREKARARKAASRGPASRAAEIDVSDFAGTAAGDIETLAAKDRGEAARDAELKGLDIRHKINDAMRVQNEMAIKLAESMGEVNIVTTEANDNMQQMAVGGLANMASGMWDVVDAALAGEMSIGQAMLAMLKGVLMGIAKESTVKAVFQVAEGIAALASTWGVPNPKSIAHFAAAAKYGAVAAISGGVGLAVGAAARSAGGAGAANAARGGSAGASPVRPSVGRERPGETTYAPIINVYLDQQNPAAGLHWRKQIAAELQRQAA